jgi:hypothetical protein
MTASHRSLAPDYVEAELEDSCATLLALELLRPTVAGDRHRTEQLVHHISLVGRRIAELRRHHGPAADPIAFGCVFAANRAQPVSGSPGSGL